MIVFHLIIFYVRLINCILFYSDFLLLKIDKEKCYCTINLIWESEIFILIIIQYIGEITLEKKSQKGSRTYKEYA